MSRSPDPIREHHGPVRVVLSNQQLVWKSSKRKIVSDFQPKPQMNEYGIQVVVLNLESFAEDFE